MCVIAMSSIHPSICGVNSDAAASRSKSGAVDLVASAATCKLTGSVQRSCYDKLLLGVWVWAGVYTFNPSMHVCHYRKAAVHLIRISRCDACLAAHPSSLCERPGSVGRLYRRSSCDTYDGGSCCFYFYALAELNEASGFWSHLKRGDAS